MDKWKDPSWKYNDAATTAKPGYLKRRMKLYETREKEKLEKDRQLELERISKVRQIRK